MRNVEEKPCGISKMDEPVLDVVENTQPVVEPVIEKAAVDAKLSEPAIENPPKNKGGRPAGSKDKAPRRKKIVEEPIVKELPKPEPAPPSTAAPEPNNEPKAEPNHEPKRVEPEPLSPCSLLRQSANHMLEAKRLAASARKSHLGNAYTRGLATF